MCKLPSANEDMSALRTGLRGGLRALVARLLVIVLWGVASSRAASFSTKVTDGLGRTVGDVTVQIYWLEKESRDGVREMIVAKLRSDTAGIAKGDYDDTTVPPGERVLVKLTKDGYSGFTSTKLQDEFVLQQLVHTEDLTQAASLAADAQRERLREILAARFA